MTRELPRANRTQSGLLIGLCVIAVLFLFEGAVGSFLTVDADSRARMLANEAVASVQELSRIVHDVAQQRIALSRYLFVEGRAETGDDALVRLERELAVLDADLKDAARAYAPYATLPGEAALWQETQVLLDRFQKATVDVLELSRRHASARARERLSSSLRDYDALNRKLIDLVQLNRAHAAAALDRLALLQRDTVRLLWCVEIAGLVVLLLVGLWGSRRIARYEKRLAGYARELENRNRDLDAFAGRVAHDLKNALAPIVMSPDMLRRSFEDPDSILEIAARTERCSNRATAVIDALLAFARASQAVEPDESAALAPVVSDVCEELAPLAAQVDASMEVLDIPEVYLRCNAGLLHIVLANLCGNAVKYLEGRAERRVRISARAENSSCTIEVEDTGPGIPRAVQEGIFRPFFRIEGSRAFGTGIGLATVRRIVNARGGRVSVESTEGKGSRFIVSLPIVPSPVDQRTQHVPEVRTSAHP